MALKIVDLEEWTFLIINCPLVSLGLMANVFYLLCLSKAKLKQPLKILLEFFIWSSIVFLFFVFCTYMVMTYSKSPIVHFVMWTFMLCNVHNSMITSVWLSVYYRIKIVPLHAAFFLWVKKNIKLVIYIALFQQEVLIHVFGVTTLVDAIVNDPNHCNGTLCELHIFSFTSWVHIMKVYLLLCFVMMTLSNFSLVHYLRSHIKKVAQGNIVTQKTASQLRAANAAVFQGVIYIIFCIFYFLNGFMYTLSSSLIIGTWLSLTCGTLYVFGTTINLGIGQTVFRQRAVCIWRALSMHWGFVAPANN